MAVTVTINTIAALQAAGFKLGCIPAAIASGNISAKQTLVSLKLCFPDGEVMASLPITASTAHLGIFKYHKSDLQSALITASQTLSQIPAIQYANLPTKSALPEAAPIDLKPIDIVSDDVLLGIDKLHPAMSLLTPGSVDTAPPESTYEVLIPDSLCDRVSLRSATGLYRAVKGTGGSSRYFLVADFGHTKIAVRWKDDAFSVRFESDTMSEIKGLLLQMQITLKEQGNYASIHLSVTNGTQARLALGAMILAIGKPLSPLPNPDLIRNMGS